MFSEEDFEKLRVIARDGLCEAVAAPYERGEKGPGTWWIRAAPAVELDGVVHRPSIAGWSRVTLTEAPAADAVITTPPDWICEFVSQHEPREALGVRMRAFAKACVPYAWVGDPLTHVLVIYERDGDKWKRAHLAAGEAQGKFVPFVRVAVEFSAVWPVVHVATPSGDEGGSGAEGAGESGGASG